MKPIELKSSKAREYLKPRSPDSHKGQNGRLAIVGGSSKYYGSPALVGLAAYRSGADLVYIVAPEAVAPTIAGYSPDLMVWSYQGERLNESAFDVVNELSEKTDALVIGNGLTKEKSVLDAASRIGERWKKELVIDADCIGAVKKKGAVYTPHVVEFKRLSGKMPHEEIGERCEQVKALAAELEATVILKGKIDVISDGEKIAINKTGNAGMTCGGSGDTLTGIVGAMLATGHSHFRAACLGAYLNGLAGDLAYKKLENSLIASDIIEALPHALKTL